ncbi:hypothetical protein O181_078582 [Austropuccinia psidii MF-1]|uniref:Integrase catalytic domain-containing protein n=1 Tax=Austropuccinia psidii MF-1 TaxID=1389203 RepID=A0A9Q3FI39_9BASI|nr:hypothetical protein [Austropuccinia psidii MF-1]
MGPEDAKIMSEQILPRRNIPELNNSNFLQWKIQIKAYLMELDLIECILSNPEPLQDAAKQAEVVRKRQKTAGILIGNMGILNCQRFLSIINEGNPYRIWHKLSTHFTSNSVDNQARVFLEFLALKQEGNLDEFITNITQLLGKVASVGIVIGTPGDIKESLMAEIIVSKLSTTYNYTKEILQSQRPLDIPKVIEYLERRRMDFSDSFGIKEEQAFLTQNPNYSDNHQKQKSKKKTYPKCSNGQHNPKTKHSASECQELKKKNIKANKAITEDRDFSSNKEYSPTVHLAFNAISSGNEIIADSGCSHHMTSLKSFICNYEELNSTIMVANGEEAQILGRGSITILSNGIHTTLQCFHVTSLTATLISVGKLCNDGFKFRMNNQTCFAFHRQGRLQLKGHIINKIFYVNGQLISKPKHQIISKYIPHVVNLELLHARAGHPSVEILQRLFKIKTNPISCEACALSKSHQRPYSGTFPNALQPLEYIHMDLSGRISPSTLGGAQYYFKITDQFTSYKHVYLLKLKSEAFKYFKIFCSQVYLKFKTYPLNVVMDNGGEFTSNCFKNYFLTHGIVPHYTAPYTPQQNPISERGNCSTAEKARTLLKHAKLPNTLWGEAVVTAVLYENILPLRRNVLPAYTLWHGTPFDYSRLRVFGCQVFINIPTEQRTGKFSDTSTPGILLGYQLGQKNWRVLLTNMSIKYTHDIIFHETIFPGCDFFNLLSSVGGDLSSSMVPSSTDNSFSGAPAETLSDIQTPIEAVMPSPLAAPPSSPSPVIDLAEESSSPARRPGWDIVLQPLRQKAINDISSSISSDNIIEHKRKQTKPSFVNHIVNELNKDVSAITRSDAELFALALPDVPPTTFRQALNSADSQQWLLAIQAEKQSLEKKGVWEVVSPPSNVHLLNSVWVFKRVFDGDGNLIKHKARLCAKGCSQIPGLEYGDTYAPTGAMATLRLILSVGVTRNWHIHHMDAKTAFLNSNLTEDLYLRPPAGLELSPGKCYQLKKSIYGLKQSPRCWYQELISFFNSKHFTPSAADTCLFISQNKNWPCLVHVHVDDMTIVSPDVSRFKKLIGQRYEMEDLGELKHILGIKAVQSLDCLRLSQENLIKKILVEFGMQNAHSVLTPMDPGVYLSPASNEDHSLYLALDVNYRRAVGLINSLAISTRPYLAFPVSILSQHLERPGIQHWRAFKRILRYLVGTQQLGLTLSRTDILIRTYADASYANCPSTRRSHTGLLVYLGQNLIH